MILAESLYIKSMILSIVHINTVGDDEKMYFQRLKDLREDKDLRQVDIAEILETSQTIYSRYERGEREIPVRHLIRLADFYSVPTDYILGRTNVLTPYPKN